MPGYGGGDASGDDPGGQHDTGGGNSGSSGDSGGGEGGFGGLGIGNPGSYGGGQTVGSPGFSGGYSDAGGVSGYSGIDVGSELGKGLVNAAQVFAAVSNPLAWGSIPANIKAAYANFDAVGAMLASMGLGSGSGLSSSVGGGGEGGGDQDRIGQYLSGLVLQNEGAGLGSPTGMEAILKSMYSGDDPQYSLPQIMADYTTRVTDAGDAQSAAIQAMSDEWKAFEQEYFAVADDYSQTMDNLPTLDMILPTGFGGGSIPLAAGKFANIASQKAGTQKSLLDSIAPAMENRSNLAQNDFTSQMSVADALMRPFNTAMDLYTLDKQIQGNLDVANASKPEDKSSIWDSLIPAAAYALGNWFD